VLIIIEQQKLDKVLVEHGCSCSCSQYLNVLRILEKIRRKFLGVKQLIPTGVFFYVNAAREYKGGGFTPSDRNFWRNAKSQRRKSRPYRMRGGLNAGRIDASGSAPASADQFNYRRNNDGSLRIRFNRGHAARGI